MKIHFAVMIALLMSANAASGQTLVSHVSDAAVDTVGKRFGAALKEGGMMQVIADIKACYQGTTSERTQANGTFIAMCMLYDEAALELDNEMRQEFVAQGSKDPGNVSSYLTDTAVAARFNLYRSIPFGDDTAVAKAYFAGAPTRVLQKAILK